MSSSAATATTLPSPARSARLMECSMSPASSVDLVCTAGGSLCSCSSLECSTHCWFSHSLYSSSRQHFVLDEKEEVEGSEKCAVKKVQRSSAFEMAAFRLRTPEVAFCFAWDPAASCSPFVCDVAKNFLCTTYPSFCSEHDRSPKQCLLLYCPAHPSVNSCLFVI